MTAKTTSPKLTHLLTPKEKDAHYGRLNARFDERERYLYQRGFKREALPGLNMSVYTRTRCGQVYALAASLVQCADDIVWADECDRIERWIA